MLGDVHHQHAVESSLQGSVRRQSRDIGPDEIQFCHTAPVPFLYRLRDGVFREVDSHAITDTRMRREQHVPQATANSQTWSPGFNGI